MIASLKRNNYFITILLLLFIFSCNDNSYYNKYKSIDSLGWKPNEPVSFNFKVKDTIIPKNLFINIRSNSRYEFSNLYLISELTFPNKETVIIDTLQYKMTDATGKFLGNGITEIKENKLYYKEKKVFPVKGNYVFSVRHSMRRQGKINPIPYLKGIQEVGFSIEKID